MGEGFDKKLGRTVSRPERSYHQHDYLDEESGFKDSGIYLPSRISEDEHMVDLKAPYPITAEDEATNFDIIRLC